MKLTDKDINFISQDLMVGMKVLLNRQTLEYKSVIDLDDIHDTEYCDFEIEKIQNAWLDQITLSKMDSNKAYNVMMDFVHEITDNRLQDKVVRILGEKSPFARFKIEVESSNHRQRWFDFKALKYMEYVKEQLDAANIEHD
jgi:hypothetical protein